MSELRIGVLGLGSIFRRVMTDMHNAQNCCVTAVAARDIERAKAAAEKYGIENAYGSYEELAASDKVDLIYVATPHSFHKEHTMLCLEHGKHVICEKAFAKNDAEAVQMVEYARSRGLFLMEAMWTRFMPAIKELKRLIDSGEVGKVKYITADFSYASEFDPASRIYAPELCGGALLDVGIYPLSICAFLLGDNPVRVQSTCIKAESGVDARTLMQLEYEDGAAAQLMCGVDVNGTSCMTILTDKCCITVPDFWHATKLDVGGNITEFPQETEGHHHQFEHAAECIFTGKTDSDIMPVDETVRLMKLMTDIRYAHGVRYPGE